MSFNSKYGKPVGQLPMHLGGQSVFGQQPTARFGMSVQSPFGQSFQQPSPWSSPLNAMMQGEPQQEQGGGIGGFLGKVGDFAGKHKDALSLAGNVAGGLFQAKMGMDENKRREREAAEEREERERKRQKDANLAPLRAQLIQMMLGNSGGQ